MFVIITICRLKRMVSKGGVRGWGGFFLQLHSLTIFPKIFVVFVLITIVLCFSPLDLFEGRGCQAVFRSCVWHFQVLLSSAQFHKGSLLSNFFYMVLLVGFPAPVSDISKYYSVPHSWRFIKDIYCRKFFYCFIWYLKVIGHWFGFPAELCLTFPSTTQCPPLGVSSLTVSYWIIVCLT